MLTQARLKEFLSYDPETGAFTNIKSGKGRKPVGVVVGLPRGDGYTSSMIDGKNYLHHRLAWLYVHGEFPPADVDHISGVRNDNRLINLRPAERHENCQNITTQDVRFESGKWRARICIQGQRHCLGRHTHREDAEAACLEAKMRLHTFQPTPRRT